MWKEATINYGSLARLHGFVLIMYEAIMCSMGDPAWGCSDQS